MQVTGDALSILRTTDRAGGLSGQLAEIWKEFLGPHERRFLFAAAFQATEKDFLEDARVLLNGIHTREAKKRADAELRQIAEQQRLKDWHIPWHEKLPGYVPPPSLKDWAPSWKK